MRAKSIFVHVNFNVIHTFVCVCAFFLCVGVFVCVDRRLVIFMSVSKGNHMSLLFQDSHFIVGLVGRKRISKIKILLKRIRTMHKNIV